MGVYTTKGVLCCEFDVRIDADGTESAEEIARLAQEVFEKYQDILMCRVLDGDTRPVGELFQLTIGNKGQVQFFIPSSSLKRLCKEIKENRQPDRDRENVAADEYVPRKKLS